MRILPCIELVSPAFQMLGSAQTIIFEHDENGAPTGLSSQSFLGDTRVGTQS